MKKNYFLLSGLALVSAGLLAQGVSVNAPEAQAKLTNAKADKAKAVATNKAPLDTLYYDSFAGGPNATDMPVGTWGGQTVNWTSINPNNNGFDWIWSDQAPGGQYSTTVTALTSTSAADGYLSMPADAYNTPAPGPGGTFIDIDATVQSSAITITPSASVLITIETSNRYCCSKQAVDLIMEVSADGQNWSSGINPGYYDGANGNDANTFVSNATTLTFNVTEDLAFEDTAYVRFVFRGGSHYYWMIDDLTILQGHDNSMKLEDYSVNFTDTFDLNPIYGMYPQRLLQPMNFDGAVFVGGANAQPNFSLYYEMYHDSTLTGGAGDYLTAAAIDTLNPLAASTYRDTANVGPYINTREGYFRARIGVRSDSVNATPAISFVDYSFIVTDSVLSKGIEPENLTGVGSYQGGGNRDDIFVSFFNIGRDSAEATSLSFFVANVPENNGVQITPLIYDITESWDTATTIAGVFNQNAKIAYNTSAITIDTTMFGRWITFPFLTPAGLFGTGPQMLYGGRQYAIGWQQLNGGGLEFTTGRFTSVENRQPTTTNWVSFAGNSWGWVGAEPSIRVNFGGLTVGVDEVDAVEDNRTFAVSPNPTNGEFTIKAESSEPTTYTLNVRNMLGQVVFNEQVSLNGQLTKNMNLSNLDKGVYFVSLENDQEKLVKKIVLK